MFIMFSYYQFVPTAWRHYKIKIEILGMSLRDKVRNTEVIRRTKIRDKSWKKLQK